jgi:hypothetical protein
MWLLEGGDALKSLIELYLNRASKAMSRRDHEIAMLRILQLEDVLVLKLLGGGGWRNKRSYQNPRGYQIEVVYHI